VDRLKALGNGQVPVVVRDALCVIRQGINLANTKIV
jgi:hypothetical protein